MLILAKFLVSTHYSVGVTNVTSPATTGASMNTTKAPCDLLVTAQRVLTQAYSPVLHDGALAIKDGIIAAIGNRKTIAEAYDAEKTLDMGESLLMPGLINSHTHASMTLLRGVADDLPLHTWLTEHIFPREAKLGTDLIGLGASLACAEMTRFGVTAFADMYLAENAVFAAAEASGLRMLGGEALFAFPSPGYACEESAFALLREQAMQWQQHPRIRMAVMPHSVYTTTPKLLARCRDFAAEHDLPVHLHLAETSTETENCIKAHGKRPLAYCSDLGLLTKKTTLAHGVHFTDEELDLLAESGAVVAHCPRSNMKLASGIARVPQMIDRGIPVALGTDGAASSNNLNIFQEMAMAALLHKVNAMDPTMVSARTVIAMATENGAKALHWHGLGVLQEGSPADAVALSMTDPNMRPVHSSTSNLVYAATGLEVRLTIVAGEILYKDGVFSRFDMEELRKSAQKAAALLQ